MKYRDFRLDALFKIIPGEFHATSELDPGSIPLISCGEENNGRIGHYDIPSEKTHVKSLTVSFNGFPLTTNYHPYRFGAKDDAAILVPTEPMTDGVLIYIAAVLNTLKWRYSYGRKCYREKLKQVTIPLPVTSGHVDADFAASLLTRAYEDVTRAAQESIRALFSAEAR